MSFKIIGAALDLPLKGNDKLVFIALCENADDTSRTCWPSYTTIQRKASLANSSLKTVLEVLEAIGLISIKIRSTKAGGRTSSLYKISEFDVEKFDVINYKKIAKEIRAGRNFRKNKDMQPPKIDRAENHPNLRKLTQMEESAQPPKIDAILDTQPPKIGEEPLASFFQPVALREEEEEEACGVEIVASPLSPFPLCMVHLPLPVIELAIDKCVIKNSNTSRAGYRKVLMAGLAQGNESWISEIFEFVKQVQATTEAPWDRDKQLKREEGESMVSALQDSGYANVFDFIENRCKDVQNDI